MKLMPRPGAVLISYRENVLGVGAGQILRVYGDVRVPRDLAAHTSCRSFQLIVDFLNPT